MLPSMTRVCNLFARVIWVDPFRAWGGGTAKLIALALIAILLPGAEAAGRDLSIVVRSGPFLPVLQEVFLAPFTQATGIAVDTLLWRGGAERLAAEAGGGGNWDLVLVNPEELTVGCTRGWLQKLNFAAIGGHEHYLPQAVSECGVGAYMQSIVLSWDRSKLQGSPTWADFWDIAKYPGKRGLRADVVGNLEIALLADGVPLNDVYSVLRTEDGVRRAFRKLDQLRPYIVWWHDDPQAVEILRSGEVLMSSAPNNQVALADGEGGKHFGVQWAGSLFWVQSWAIMAGSPNVALALRFLQFFGDPARQAQFPKLLAVGGLVKGANDRLPPAEQAISPSSASNLRDALGIDPTFWRENLPRLRQRFEAWLKH